VDGTHQKQSLHAHNRHHFWMCTRPNDGVGNEKSGICIRSWALCNRNRRMNSSLRGSGYPIRVERESLEVRYIRIIKDVLPP
jgi:hypothetical protein